MLSVVSQPDMGEEVRAEGRKTTVYNILSDGSFKNHDFFPPC